MSVVSGIVIMCSVCEETAGEDGPVVLLAQLNDWISDRYRVRPMAPLDEAFGGNKHPQLFCIGAGINAFDEDAFADFVVSLPWEMPENVVLVIQPEDGPTRIFRPKDSLI